MMQRTAPTIGIKMSAYGYYQTFSHTLNYVRFAPESGHS